MSKARSHLSLEDVDSIARLARLRLTPEERPLYQQQLSDILEYVKTLEQLDTTDIDPTFRVLPQTAPLRADEVRDSFPVQAMLANAPARSDVHYRIPRILDET